MQHHAYIYEGSLGQLPALVESVRKQFKFLSEHDPDVRVFTFEKFGIEEARELKIASSLRSVSGRMLFIVGVGNMTSESQQALLKLFEEPQEGAIFVLLAPHGAIISTLRSRLLPYPEQGETLLKKPRSDLGKKFLAMSYKDRSTEITKLLKDEDGIRERVRDFLNELEALLYADLQKSKEKKSLAQALQDISRVRSYLNDRSPSMKMLLEHLAATI